MPRREGRSAVAFAPARQVGVIVLATSAILVDDIGMHVVNPMVPLAMPMLPTRASVEVPAAVLDRLVGDYALTPTMLLQITREGGVLYARATGQARFPLTAIAPHRFVVPAAGIELTFDLGDVGPHGS